MNFNRFDIILLFTMSLAVVLMSFTFPALGLTAEGDEVNESDIPELNINKSDWDISADFPERPTTPTEGTLKRNDSKKVIGEHQAWISNVTDQDNGTSIEIASFGTGNHTINVGDFEDGNATVDIYNITNEGQEIRHNNNSWAIIFNVVQYDEPETANASSVVEWEIVESPNSDEGGGITSIPVIGGLWSAGESVFYGLAYIGDWIRYGVATFFNFGSAAASTLYEVMQYTVGMIAWLTGTYTSVVSGASSGWATAILSIPGVLLTVEFAKISWIGVSILRKGS